MTAPVPPTLEERMRELTRARIKAWISVIAMAIALYIAWLLIQHYTPPAPPPPADKAVSVDTSADAQRARKAHVDKMIEDGLVRRIDKTRDGSPRVTLRPAFYELDPEVRRKHLEVIYALHFDGSRTSDTVYLRDSRHGNEVGHYNPYAGGLIMVR
jgi:hypothetical protein